MRILHLTAGAGGMYCGSCLRDNTLAAELMARGHDVALLPVYTPTRTDEANVSDEHVFFGGISVYLQQHVPLLRRTPAVLDFLWDIPAVIKAAAGRGVSIEAKDLGELTVSTLRGEDGFQAKEIRKLVRYLEGLPPFDLVVIPTGLLISLAAPLRRALNRPVVCTLQGEDLFLDGLSEAHRHEALALMGLHAAAVDGFIATSGYYADFMAGYLGIPRDKIHVVPLGIHMAGFEPAPRGPSDGPFTVGYFARIAPEKGLHLLAEAYALLRKELGGESARLEAAGYLGPEHRGYLAGVESALEKAGLRSEFRYHGTVDRAGKIAFLRTIDVLSVPSPYAEPKGLYLLEAMASGVPWVQPRHGAFPEVHEKTGGGLLFEPNDPQSLAEQLLLLSRDREQARALGRRGAEGVRRHYDAAGMADRSLEVFKAVVDAAAKRLAPHLAQA
jgi:glycosyltransferase involved in cell wall biosynthesis